MNGASIETTTITSDGNPPPQEKGGVSLAIHQHRGDESYLERFRRRSRLIVEVVAFHLNDFDGGDSLDVAYGCGKQHEVRPLSKRLVNGPAGAILLLTLFALSSVGSVGAQEPGLKTTLDLTVPGIQPLDAESLKRAFVEGEQKGAVVNAPYEMRAIEFHNLNRSAITVEGATRFARLMDKQPFAFFVRSPYATATTLAAEAKRKYQPRPVVTVNQLNSHQVVVHVGPSANFLDADAIENVVLKRGADVLRPLRAKVTPLQIRNGVGLTKMVAEGDFTFSFSAFDPSSEVTIVMVGRTGNVEWTVTKEELARMK